MFQKKRISIALVIINVLFITTSFAQTVQKRLQWNASKSGENKRSVLTLEGAYTGDRYQGLPYFSESIKINSYNSARIINPVYAPLDQSLSEEQKNIIGNDIEFTSTVSFEKKQPYLTLSLFPFRKNPSNGIIEKLISYDIQYYHNSSVNTRSVSSKTYAANSVLASGNWYKIAIVKDGVYRLNYNDLKNLGIDVNTIDPRNIRLYGNGGGILPEKNSDFRYDDLFENPIQVIGQNDGTFNEGDYILFYAKGPDQWKYNITEKAFNHELNPYSTESYYFITTDLGTGKRIETRNNSSSSPNFFVNTFNDYQLHEVDQNTSVNAIIKSGRERYGEEFNGQLNYDFDFSFPNLIKSTHVKVKTAVIGRSGTPGSSTFTVKFNNANLYSILCNGVRFDYDQPFGSERKILDSALSNSDNIRISIAYNKPTSSSIGFLNFLELNAVRQLTMSGEQMSFRNVSSAGAGKISSFTINNTISSTEIWDVTDKVNPVVQSTVSGGNNKTFILPTDTLKEFISFNNTLSPLLVGKIPNQNLHATGFPDLIIFSHPDFVSQSERLADYRRQNNGMDVLVITPEKIYNEFSSGARDASAIRDFLKMLYDRAGTDQNKMPRYLLLMGDGSYDNKGIIADNTAFLPTFESRSSNIQYDNGGSYVSDDYFGMLDDIEGGWDVGSAVYGTNALDVAVGRLPVQSPDQARQMVDKIIHYSNPETFGDWRNKYVLVADDQDFNLHFSDAEKNYKAIIQKTQKFNIDKIYLDAYPQLSTPAGNRYPDVNEALNQEMSNGSLIINYAGHGGEVGLGHEKIMTLDDINSWDNFDKMPLLVTATCSFSRWDDPSFQSAGEQSLLNPKGGAIALFTTTRVVNSSGNLAMNQNFIKALFDTVVNNGLTLGDVFLRSKNLGTVGLTQNNRNFTLLGDPSLPFAIPRLNVMTEKINGISIQDTAAVDTLKALSKVTVTGYITDQNGNKLTNYNGIVYPLVFDKKTTQKTLGQDQDSYVAGFELQKNVIYKGKSSVRNGEFSYTFVVPKDISYSPGYGRLSYYSNTGNIDANGNYDSIVVGGSSNSPITDLKGPEINIFLNDENFAAGGLIGENPKLIVKLKDENGINTVGNGIGHNLMATLIKDGQEKNIELNNYYEAKLDSYQEGEINYPMNKLEPGNYQLKIKAWDVFNNSNESTTDFRVAESKEFALDHVLNYPNPFTTLTDFQFEHNRPGDDLKVQIQVFTVAGRLVKTINRDVAGQGSRVTNIKWDGKDDYGDKIGRGVYLYKLKVRSSDGSIADKYEKLVVLN
jgi:hypothetical protein